jgi:DNA-binding transcriptional MerR regulator
MKIGEASLARGASPRTLRLYEEEGSIEPGRFENGYRDYCSATIERVRAIRSLLDAGVPVRLIKEVLPVVVDDRNLDGPTRAALERYHDRIVRRINQLDERRASLAMFIVRLDGAGS